MVRLGDFLRTLITNDLLRNVLNFQSIFLITFQIWKIGEQKYAFLNLGYSLFLRAVMPEISAFAARKC